jgi:LPS-assembly lipoprotein
MNEECRRYPQASAAPGGRAIARAAKVLAALMLAALTTGCLQPLYGDRTSVGGSNVQIALANVDVQQIPAATGTPESRIAVELRNQLLFGLGGGAAPTVPTHQLRIRLVSTRLSVIVDVTTARPDVENYGLNATYELVEMRTGKIVVNDTTFSRVSVDVPGQQQRFARQRGVRDAENRATQVIADNIRNRLASYFTAGT